MKDSQKLIQEKYGDVAKSGLNTNNSAIKSVAEAFGYSAEQLSSIPAEANMGLSCGNPLATASIKEGEVVVDLGSGGGLDVFLAAKKVGPQGRVIGIDMTKEMVELARLNAEKGGIKNVEFIEGLIDNIPLDDASTDLVISNCVINLAPEKSKVFQEIFRILRPGGRVAISDISLKQALPLELAESAAALVGCIAGAIPMQEYEDGLKNAGFSEVAVVDSKTDLTAYSHVKPSSSKKSCCGSRSMKPLHQDLNEILEKYDLNAYAASVRVFAKK